MIHRILIFFVSNDSCISIFHQNVQSLGNKLTELEVFLSKTNFDFVCISEHWFRSDRTDLLKLNGYYVADCYYRKIYKNGGVVIFAKTNFKCFKMNKINKLSIDKHFECAAIKIIHHDYVFFILTLYRSPDGDLSLFFKKLSQTLNILHNFNNARIVVTGDFNINFLMNSKALTDLLDIFNSFNIKHTINEPTRGFNCIDNICITGNLNSHSSHIITNGLSDHEGQCIKFKCSFKKSKPQTIQFREVSKTVNILKFKNTLLGQDWSSVLDQSDVNIMFNNFSNIVSSHFNNSFPLITKINNSKNNCKNKWITKGILISSQKIKDIYRQIKNGNTDLKQYYVSYKKIYRKVILKAKQMYNESLLTKSTNKSKTAWTIINGCNDKPKEEITLNINNNLITDPKIIVNCFNEFFSTIADSFLSTSNLPPNQLIFNNIIFNANSFFLKPTDENEVTISISEMKNSKSTGYDNININLIKFCLSELITPLVAIVNCSFNTGVFPSAMKVAKVIPLHKKGSKTLIDNFRPISLLTSFSKLLEKIMSNRIVSFFDKYNLFNTSQFGFRKKCSTSSAICKFLDELYTNLDKDKSCLGIFIDLSKAFDLVNHNILIDKLYKYGIRDLALDWLRSYLANRIQFVELNGNRSNELSLNKGVPQGSVLGPLLFLIYVNDMPLSNTIKFADDTSILVSSDRDSDISINANNDVFILQKWFIDNDLFLNSKKSSFIRFNMSNINYDHSLLIKADNCSIAQVSNTKFLGVEIDQKCSWNCHIDNLCNKLASLCYVLKQLRHIVHFNILKTYYFAHFQSNLTYGIIAWGNASGVQRVFKMQKRALRFMLGLSYDTSCKAFFIKHSILTVPSLYILNLLIYTKQNINGFETLQQPHNYSTRSTSVLSVPKHKYSFYKKSTRYLGTIAFNKLPIEFKNMDLKKFKKRFGEILAQKAYYSFNEFLDDF